VARIREHRHPAAGAPAEHDVARLTQAVRFHQRADDPLDVVPAAEEELRWRRRWPWWKWRRRAALRATDAVALVALRGNAPRGIVLTPQQGAPQYPPGNNADDHNER
jgi:hypothetical protein